MELALLCGRNTLETSEEGTSSANSTSHESGQNEPRSSLSPPRPFITFQYAASCLSWIMKGLNGYHDSNLRNILFRHCTTNLMVINHCYGAAAIGRRGSKSSFHTTMHLEGIEAFLEYWSLVQSIIPDGFFHIQDLRGCETTDDQRTSLYMSMFGFSGTNIKPDTNYMDYLSIMKLKKQRLHTVIFPLDELSPLPILSTSGSLGMYFNRAGLVYRLEFFYQSNMI